MIKNLPFQFKDLEIHIQKMLTRLGVIEAKIPQIDTIQTELDALVVKQNNEKLIQCIATQRTTNSGATAEISPSDEAFTANNSVVQRRLNNFECTQGAADYFELRNSGTATAEIVIKKPGTYKVSYSTVGSRCNYWNSSIRLLRSGVEVNRLNRVGRTATGATTAGNSQHVSASGVMSINANDVLILEHYTETRTAGFTLGVFFTVSTLSTDTCSLEITLIKE